MPENRVFYVKYWIVPWGDQTSDRWVIVWHCKVTVATMGHFLEFFSPASFWLCPLSCCRVRNRKDRPQSHHIAQGEAHHKLVPNVIERSAVREACNVCNTQKSLFQEGVSKDNHDDQQTTSPPATPWSLCGKRNASAYRLFLPRFDRTVGKARYLPLHDPIKFTLAPFERIEKKNKTSPFINIPTMQKRIGFTIYRHPNVCQKTVVPYSVLCPLSELVHGLNKPVWSYGRIHQVSPSNDTCLI